MRTIGCRDIQREIEEAGQSDPLSFVADEHLNNCAGCETFYNEQSKLRQIVGSLGTVAAPGDFDFCLRARLAGEKRGGTQRFALGNFTFGLRSAAFTLALLLIGSGLLFVSLRPDANSPVQSASTVPNLAPRKADAEDSATLMAVPPAAGESNAVAADLNPEGQRGSSSGGRRGPGPTRLASVGRGRPTSRDMASTQASVFKSDELSAAAGNSVFPLEASPKALKVSLDNGRGSSKTISLPGVSFGSQRVLSQSTSPLMASTRGAW